MIVCDTLVGWGVQTVSGTLPPTAARVPPAAPWRQPGGRHAAARGEGVGGSSNTSVEVLLAEKVENLGEQGEIVRVKPGYARNYLLPHGLAYEATEGNKKRIAAVTRAGTHAAFRSNYSDGRATDLAELSIRGNLQFEPIGDDGHHRAPTFEYLAQIAKVYESDVKPFVHQRW